MDVLQLTYSPGNEHLGYFQFGAIILNSALDQPLGICFHSCWVSAEK